MVRAVLPPVPAASPCRQAADILVKAKQVYESGDRLQAMKLYEDVMAEVGGAPVGAAGGGCEVPRGGHPALDPQRRVAWAVLFRGMSGQGPENAHVAVGDERQHMSLNMHVTDPQASWHLRPCSATPNTKCLPAAATAPSPQPSLAHQDPTPEQKCAALYGQTAVHAAFGDVELAQMTLRGGAGGRGCVVWGGGVVVGGGGGVGAGTWD